jgi:DeoR/GlpR family transcriptional regulator of sugar metabolism
VIVVADHTKVNTVATAYLSPITSINIFVTDSETPAEFISGLKKAGIKVHIA